MSWLFVIMHLKQRSDDIVFLIGDTELFLWDSLYGIIDPLLAAVICIYKSLLFTKDLVALLRAITE